VGAVAANAAAGAKAATVAADAEAGVAAGGFAAGDVASSVAEVCGVGPDGAGAAEGDAPTAAPALSRGITSPGSFTTS
jgi:hypothetical protein